MSDLFSALPVPSGEVSAWAVHTASDALSEGPIRYRVRTVTEDGVSRLEVGRWVSGDNWSPVRNCRRRFEIAEAAGVIHRRLDHFVDGQNRRVEA